MTLRTVGVRGFVAASLLVLTVGVAGGASVAGAQEATDDTTTTDADVVLPEAYLDAYAWWSKAQQAPQGGQPVPSQPCQPTPEPTNVNQCPAGPPAEGIYVVYDYEAANPTPVTGPVSNLPAPTAPEQPPGSPAPNLATPEVLGPMAYGAVRYVVPDGAETELTLTILSKSSTTPAGQDPAVGKVFGCLVATPGWSAVQNGRYDQAPSYDCSSADEAEVSGDTVVFQFPSGMVQNGTLDVVIVGAGDRPFQMSLSAPRDDSLRIVNADALAEELVEFSEEEFSFEDPLAEFTESTDAFVDTSLTGDIAYSSDESVLPSVAPVPRPTTERAVTAGRFVNPFSPDASRGERIMAVALLLLIGGGLWWVGGLPIRPPRLLGSLGNGRTQDAGPSTQGGIGRFTRPRQGRPPRLF